MTTLQYGIPKNVSCLFNDVHNLSQVTFLNIKCQKRKMLTAHRHFHKMKNVHMYNKRGSWSVFNPKCILPDQKHHKFLNIWVLFFTTSTGVHITLQALITQPCHTILFTHYPRLPLEKETYECKQKIREKNLTNVISKTKENTSVNDNSPVQYFTCLICLKEIGSKNING